TPSRSTTGRCWAGMWSATSTPTTRAAPSPTPSTRASFDNDAVVLPWPGPHPQAGTRVGLGAFGQAVLTDRIWRGIKIFVGLTVLPGPQDRLAEGPQA